MRDFCFGRWDLVPWPGIKPGPLHWEHRVLATKPPRKSTPTVIRRSNQSILKEINPEYSLEGLKLKLKLWPPDVKRQLIRKDPDAGKDWRQKKEMMVGWYHQLNGHEFEQTHGRWWRSGKPGVLQPMGLQRVRHDWMTEQQQQIYYSEHIMRLKVHWKSHLPPCYI